MVAAGNSGVFVGWWLAVLRLWRSGKATDRLSHYLSRGRLLWLTPLILPSAWWRGGV
ncbi:DedA family integral membrane protein [Escherichia coli]|uniref:DedA family integral membrane protein n=1 Tax=Escherichia coli TaxID=562 RepID=A0A485JNG1_ECOLX|nr:DedA family integral membrane protein [Escherichia coli]